MTDEIVSVSSAQELLDHLQLQTVMFYEVSGKRHPEDPDADNDTPPSPTLRILQRHDERSFEVRCMAVVEAPDATYVADAAAIYTADALLDIPQAVGQEFVERVGVMSVYPFIREAILTTSAKLGAGQVLLGMLRAGRVYVEPDEGTESEADS